jgi:hypothetical protein
MINFWKTGQRLDEVENDLAATGDLAVSINAALDRVEGELKKVRDFSADRISDLQTRVDALSRGALADVESVASLTARLDALERDHLQLIEIVNRDATEQNEHDDRLTTLETAVEADEPDDKPERRAAA